MSIINRVLLKLSEMGRTQIELCDYINIGSSTMANWKTRNTDPPAKYIIPICEFLNVTTDYLLTGKEKSTPQNDLTETEQEMLKLYSQLQISEQYKIIGMLEEKLKNT